MAKLLDVTNLRTSFFTPEGEVKAVSGVSYHVDQEEIIAVVGESGCGKSVTQMSVMQLIQTPPGKIHPRFGHFHDLPGAHDLFEPCSDRGLSARRDDLHP